MSRPDITYAVHILSQFMQSPRKSHLDVPFHVLRYLKSFFGQGLLFPSSNDLLIRAYCDADWTGDVEERRSTTGYVFFLGVGAISWNCRKQPTIALSTTEAEYMATSQCTKEAMWIRKLLEDVGYVQENAMPIMCDNQGCIALAKNPKHHSRTKHIDVQHHFIREKLEEGVVILKYCPTEIMVADVLTKALARPRHEKLRVVLGLKTFDNLQSGSVVDNG